MKALYLKYRPQNLNELIGQEVVKKPLLSAFQANKLSHAYLLVGPRGTGKTSTARILAKMVNCLERKSPCNKCAICTSITDGSNLDLIEIDAASNRGVDDIRSLRENIKLSPSASQKKVYIIDEVHMLTTEAFNALLKTLEEPPEHVLFILATTELGKIPQTILSRVQRLDFKLATSEELIEALKRVVKKENIDIEDEALNILIRSSGGSFRDSVKLLDQMASLGEKITAKMVIDSLNQTGFEDLNGLLINLSDKNSKEALLSINKIVDDGGEAKALAISLTDVLRALMLIKNDLGSQLVSAEYSSDQYSKLQSLADKFNMQQLSGALEALQKALEKIKFASIPVLPLELAVIEICSEESSDILPSIVEEQPAVVDPLLTAKENNSPDLDIINEKWTFVLETIRPYNFSLEALLRSVKIIECIDGVVILEVPYSFHQRILETPKSRDLLESVISDVLGKSAKVSTVLGQRPVRVEDIANVEIAADDEIIRAASEIFEGSLID